MINNILLTILLVIAIIALIALSLAAIIFAWNKVYKICFSENHKKKTKVRIIKKLNELKEDTEYFKEQEDFADEDYDLLKDEISKYESRLSELTESNNKEFTLKDAILAEKVKAQIDEMISVSVYSQLRNYIILKTKYPITNIDSDISEISKKVFKGINPIILDVELVMSNDFLMEYVINQAFNLTLKIVVEHNASIIE